MVSRRDILKTIGLIGVGAMAGFRPDAADLAKAALSTQGDLPPLPPSWTHQPMGRVSGEYMNLRGAPTSDGELLGRVEQDEILRVWRVVEGEDFLGYNPLWLETPRGYVYSSFVQPMDYHLPARPVAELGPDGKWAELIAPYSDAYWDPTAENPDRWVYRMYYGSVFRVTDLVQGSDGRAWYKIKEMYQGFYMPATHFRIIPREDLSVISPDVDPADKRLEVNLRQQVITAYERGVAVWRHRVATGLPGFETPAGIHYIFDKRASERMVGGRAATEDEDERYNLGGVPFVCYFTADWVATHGCYWHNDYGQRHSHGCVNLPNYAARWIWRWTTPYVDYDEFYREVTYRLDGTRVDVIEG